MNRKPIKYGTLALLTILLVAGCSSDEPSENNSLVEFVTNLEQAVTRSSTRDNMWNTTDEIAITDGTTVKKYKPAEGGASVALEKADSEAKPFYWAIGKGDMTFSAWSPYTVTNESLEVTVASDQRATPTDAITDNGTLTDAAFNAYDLLYAPARTAASGTTVPLQFYHQMAHIVVYIIGVATEKEQNPETGEFIDKGEVEEVTRIVLGSEQAKMALTGTLMRRGMTGAEATSDNQALWSVGSGTGTITMRDMDTQTGQVVTGYKKRRVFECILPPQSGGTNPTYKLVDDEYHVDTHGTVLMTFYTTKRNDNEGSSPYKYESAFNYQAGYEYVYYIGLTRAGLYVDYVVQDWATLMSNNARSVFNYMDHPGVLITDWTAPGSTTPIDLGNMNN